MLYTAHYARPSYYVITGGLVFAPSMRRKRYCTMLDPLEEKYGSAVTSLIYLSSLFGDVLWSASILAALGQISILMCSNCLNHWKCLRCLDDEVCYTNEYSVNLFGSSIERCHNEKDNVHEFTQILTFYSLNCDTRFSFQTFNIYLLYAFYYYVLMACACIHIDYFALAVIFSS